MSAAHPTEAERHIVALRSSARRLLGPAVLFLALAVAVPWLSGALTQSWQSWIVVVAGAVLLVFGCIVPLLSWLARRVIVTSRKLVTQSGLVTRVRGEVLHARKYAVTVEQSPMQRIFRTGDLVIRVQGEDEPLRLTDLPSPVLLQSLLGELVAAAPAAAAVAPVGAAMEQHSDVTVRLDTDLLAELGDDS